MASAPVDRLLDLREDLRGRPLGASASMPAVHCTMQRVLALALCAAAPAPARGGVWADKWADSPHLEEFDFNDKTTHKLLKARPVGSPPILVRNGVAGLEPLLALKSTRKMKKLLASMGTKEMPGEVKHHKTALFSYWDDTTQWTGKSGMLNLPKEYQRSWHQWRKKPCSQKYYFKHAEESAAPYLYFLMELATERLNFESDPRVTLCRRFAPKKMEDTCIHTVDPNTGQSEDSPPFLWGNTAGLLTQAHFDRETNMFLQIKGYKKWTFFEPSQLGDLCFYPYAHPSARQVQADMFNSDGIHDGVGARCAAYEKLHNRTVIVGPGDVLIVPPYHVHRVETLNGSVGYSISYKDAHVMSHNHFEDKFVQDLISTVLNHKTVAKYERKCDRRGKCEKSEEEVAKPRAKASAALRYMLRETLKAAIGEGEVLRAFLRDHWKDWASLPDVAVLSEGGDPSAMCADEKALSPKLTKQLTKVGGNFVKIVMSSDLIRQHVEAQAIVREEMRWVLGASVFQ